MKKMIVGMLVGVVMGSMALADVETVVNAEVKYQVKTVKVSQVMVSRNRDGLVLNAPYTWLDATNKVLRQGSHRATQAQLTAALGESAPVVIGVLSNLTPTNGIGPMFMLNFLPNGSVSGMSRTMVQAGTNRTMSVTRYATNEIAAALSPLTVNQVKGMVQALTADVLQN